MPKFGFYEYDDAVVGSDGIIAKHSMTSAADMPAGAGILGAGAITYGNDGATFEASSGWSITPPSSLTVEGTMRFMISKECNCS